MREIKFRGRSIDGWLYGETIWFNRFPTLNDKQIYMPNPNDENCDELNIETWSIVFDVCQFTGLKDMNGKEIYEGDILDYGCYGKFEVVWHNGAFKIRKLGFKNGNLSYLADCYLDELEVIGNIYENPELIK